MSDDLVLVERPEPHVAILRLNRPRVRNALNAAMRDELAGHCHAIAADDSVRVVIITGGPEHFAAGADLSEFVNRSAADILRDKSWDNWRAVADLPQPVIAAVNGFCLGGGLELALACHWRIAAANVKVRKWLREHWTH